MTGCKENCDFNKWDFSAHKANKYELERRSNVGAKRCCNNMVKDGDQITYEEQINKDHKQTEDTLPPKHSRKLPTTRCDDFFMGRHLQEVLNVKDNEIRKLDLNSYLLKILHNNVQHLNNKLQEISMLLSVGNINVDILCYNEHRLREDKLSNIYTDQFRFVSNLSRSSRNCGGSGIFVTYFLQTKYVKYRKELASKNTFELAAVKLLDFNYISHILIISTHTPTLLYHSFISEECEKHRY
jgi:hypothetical protein